MGSTKVESGARKNSRGPAFAAAWPNLEHERLVLDLLRRCLGLLAIAGTLTCVTAPIVAGQENARASDAGSAIDTASTAAESSPGSLSAERPRIKPHFLDEVPPWSCSKPASTWAPRYHDALATDGSYCRFRFAPPDAREHCSYSYIDHSAPSGDVFIEPMELTMSIPNGQTATLCGRALRCTCDEEPVDSHAPWSPEEQAHLGFTKLAQLPPLLDDPKVRDRALCTLLQRQSSSGAEAACEDADVSVCRVNAVAVDKGSGARVVFKAEGFDRAGWGPGVRRGHVLIVAPDGRLSSIFDNDNVSEEGSALFDYTGNGQLALALVVPIAATVPDPGSPPSEVLVQQLAVAPVAAQDKPLLVLLVGPPLESELKCRDGSRPGPHPQVEPERHCIGATCATYAREEPEPDCPSNFAWTWRFRPDAKGQSPNIEIGPWEALDAGHPVATYVWSPASKRYTGPEGSPAQLFQRLGTSDGGWSDPPIGVFARGALAATRGP
jgi:hypothetical protein